MTNPKASRPRAIVLVDGEHYLPVIQSALETLRDSYAFVGGVFLGGTEKVSADGTLGDLGVPVLQGSSVLTTLEQAVRRFDPEVAVDLSDEPIVGYRERFQMASMLLSLGITYAGKDFTFSPPSLLAIRSPAISVVGTGKRTGKTAIAGHAARLLKDRWNVGMVTMGRGGPPTPEVLDGRSLNLSLEALIGYADQGLHAASGCFGHAYMTGVLVIGCRRCGGGMSGGEPFVSNVAEGAEIAEQAGLDLVIFDGSGATAPPIAVDRQMLIVGAHQPVDYVGGYFGPYRIRRSHCVILTGCEPPLADTAKVDAMEEAVRAVNPSIPVFRTVFRPRLERDVDGSRVFLAATAPPAILPRLVEHLEEHHRCRVVGSSPHLSNRPKLQQDLSSAPPFDVLLVELKAAGVDVAARSALSQEREVVFVDNEPVTDRQQELDATVERLAFEAIASKRGADTHG